MDNYIAIAIALLGGCAVYEFYIWLPPVCRAITRLAVTILPIPHRDNSHAEWQAHLNELPNSIAALTESIGFVVTALRFRAPETGRQLNGELTYWFLRPLVRRIHREASMLFEVLGKSEEDYKGILNVINGPDVYCVEEVKAGIAKLVTALGVKIKDANEVKTVFGTLLEFVDGRPKVDSEILMDLARLLVNAERSGFVTAMRRARTKISNIQEQCRPR